MIKYLVFDFDGTLADTTEGILKTTEATLQRMRLPAAEASVVQQAIGLPLQGSLRAAGVPEDRIEEAVDVYHELFYDVAPKHITIFPGVREGLELLAGKGFRMAIATSRGEPSLVSLLTEHGIRQYFEVLGTTGCVERPKPAPDLVLWVLDRFGAIPEEAMVIGDTTFDIEMGSAAGCSTCAVSYGNHSVERLQTASPNHIIPDLRVLAGLI
ncbi:MAG: HAD family hydrolase [Bacteroidales bacterium]|nr:HAD family hydrolase [Bacteroidales bacterium]MBR5073290.1 HAD family hydrolase [Bacteroidales bacterium]